MGSFTFSDGIATAQVVYYLPTLFASIYICTRHGFLKSSGWFFLVMFCLMRIIGGSALLATINSDSSTAITIALVCSVMGTSPLLLATLGLLSRIYYSILSQAWSIFFQLFALKIVQTPAVIALILCIVGATSASSPTQIESEEVVHIGMILFLYVFIMIVILTLIAVVCRKKVPDQERILIRAVALALPFIFVHILYSLLAALSNDSKFNPVTGSRTIFLCMSVVEEMVVVLLYVIAGLRVWSTPLNEDASVVHTVGYRAGRGDFGGGKLGLLSMGFGVFNAYRNQKEEEEPSEYRRRERGAGPHTGV